MVEDRHIEAAIEAAGLRSVWNVTDVKLWSEFNALTVSVQTARSILAHAEALARVEAATVDGNDIWEALFDIMQGNVPNEMTHGVCQKLADAMSTMKDAQP